MPVKEKNTAEKWSDEHLRSFLNAESFDDSEPDYIAVIHAYRHMLPDTFADFIRLFVAEGHSLSATGASGDTALQTIESHQQGKEYAEIIRQHA